MLGNMMMVTGFDHRLPLRWLMLLACLSFGIPPVLADSDAIEYLNSLRKEAGMTALRNDRELARSAQNHADYLVLHLQGDVSRMSSAHDESPGREGYTGRTPQERAVAAGYPHKQVKENVAIGHATPVEAIDGLMAAIYHRLAFLDFSIDQVGFGAASKTDVFMLGRSDLQATCYERPS
ncbi:MAG: CAP domain-containing protein, partial [Sedimenticolaceae bacterium]|nr:CAP domain-containing protein [Sedimenticolaceae bacterium]